MNIPNHIHFGLGFGFKYQYLLSTLLHALMTGNNLLSDKNKNEACQKYMIKKLAQNPSIHANVPIFMKNIKKIFPDIEKLNYKKDALLLLEGEDKFFEDINLFTTYNGTSKINFIQVKGSDSENIKKSLNKAIKKTLLNMLENKNTTLSYELIILINEEVTNWYYLKNQDDKIKMINTTMEELIKRENVKPPSIKTKILKLFDSYLNDYYNSSKDIYEYFSENSTVNQYNKIDVIVKRNENDLIKSFEKLKEVMEKTRVIDKLDHRLIYLFLKYHYGNDKLTKILWNIELKSMNGQDIKIDDIQEQLRKINFDSSLIFNMQFTKTSTKTTFRKGKIL